MVSCRNKLHYLACHEEAAKSCKWKKAITDYQHQYWQNILNVPSSAGMLVTQNLTLHDTSDQLFWGNKRNVLETVEPMAEFELYSRSLSKDSVPKNHPPLLFNNNLK